MLIAHDLEPARRPAVKLTAQDYALLRQIALEGSISNAFPPVRASAILYLARVPSVENLNLLADLARNGEDHLVRGHALLALGQCGVDLATPLLVDGLASSYSFERAAAEKGLLSLGEKLGLQAIRTALAHERLREVRERIASRLTQPAKPREPRKPSRTEQDPGRS
jgi:HEAT repeat protein